MEKETIIIAGAGIAGLVVARELADDHHIIMLEAAPRPGGRILTTHEKDFAQPVEGGAEFIHGHKKHTLEMLKEAGIEYKPVEGKMYSREKGKWIVQENMIPEWDKLLEKMKKIHKDISLFDFLQLYFGEEKYASLRRHAIAFAEGFDVADIQKVSAKALYKEWSKGEDINYRIPAGYGTLVNWLEGECRKKGCNIFYNETVKQVDWEKNDVTVITSRDKKYDGNKMIITAPVSVLKHNGAASSINITPPLDEQVKAASQVGFGAVVKVVMRFKKRFWEEDTGFIFSDEIFPTWWTQLPDESPVLSGWAGGPKADILGKENNEPILQKALTSLSNIFEIPVQQLEDELLACRVFNWQKNECAMGAYSYAMPESAAARELLNKPVDDTIYFCGETVYDGEAPGTVEAAIAHAKQTAKRINSTLSPTPPHTPASRS